MSVWIVRLYRPHIPFKCICTCPYHTEHRHSSFIYWYMLIQYFLCCLICLSVLYGSSLLWVTGNSLTSGWEQQPVRLKVAHVCLRSCWDSRAFSTFHITVVNYLSVPFTVSLCVCVCFTITAPHPVDLSVCASGLSTLELIHRKKKPVRFVTLSWQSVWHRARSDRMWRMTPSAYLCLRLLFQSFCASFHIFFPCGKWCIR